MPCLPNSLRPAQLSAAAQKLAAEVSGALTREESLRTRLEREIADHRKKAARFRVQLDSVKTPEQAEAIEHEIRFESGEADRLENEEFASLERTEAHEAALAEARSQVEILAAANEKIRARMCSPSTGVRRPTRSPQCRARNLASADRSRVAHPFRPSLRLSRHRHWPTSENQQCAGCRMGIRPQMWNQLRESELLICDSCSRILYWDPALAPAPKAPPTVGHPRHRPRPSQVALSGA